jgi:hypothetical protein
MILLIAVQSGSIYKDGVEYTGLTWAGTPSTAIQLNWDGEKGAILNSDNTLTDITALPTWATNAVAAHAAVIPPLTPRQARLALFNLGILDDVEAAIVTPEHRIWWDYSTFIERNHPLVVGVLSALGKTSAEIDTMFRDAYLT